MLLKSRNKDGLFQSKVAINCAGNRILVGSAYDSSVGLENAGAAYLYDDSGALLHIFYAPSPRAHDNFGSSVDINCEGDKILIGASNVKTVGIIYSGAAYLFNGNTGCLLQSYTNPSLHDASERAFVSQIDDGFGRSVAISDDGSRVIISAPSRSEKITLAPENPNKHSHAMAKPHGGGEVDLVRVNAGMVFMFSTDENGELLRTFMAPSPAFDNEFFGRQIAINEDASLILVGIPGKKCAQLYNDYGEIMLQLQPPLDDAGNEGGGGGGGGLAMMRSYGFSTTVNGDGTRLLVGAPGGASEEKDTHGEAYLYDNKGTLLQTYRSPGPNNNGDTFGTSVSMNYNGDRILIGAPYKDKSGSAFLFNSDGDLLQTLVYTTDEGIPDLENVLGYGWTVAQDKYMTRTVIASWWSQAIKVMCFDSSDGHCPKVNSAVQKSNENKSIFDFVCEGSVHLSAAVERNNEPSPIAFAASIVFIVALLVVLVYGYCKIFNPELFGANKKNIKLEKGDDEEENRAFQDEYIKRPNAMHHRQQELELSSLRER